MDLSRQLRSAALIYFILLALIHSSHSRYHGKRHKRQNGAHMYLPESFIVPNGEGEPDEWSEWSSPSECSRSCGGGVSFLTRECKRFASNGGQLCSGGSRKYFSCNTQDCPEEEPDFRSQQCSRFDSLPFDGVRYEWVPYTNAPNPCELNCMPRGERFYYRHKAKVIDGTRCNDKTPDVCVDGECQPVGCDMMLGSNAREDKCRKCAGDGSSCKTISGLFETNNLAAGYNDILLIPIGATNIILKEVAPSNNYLACRNLTGHYYLNGNWRIDFPRPMHFAGAWWHYQRKPTGFAAPDQLTCSGPTTESIYVVMLIQDRNVGVQYEYSIPDVVTKSFPDTYSWTHMEYGPCSASCGGGIQKRNVTCNNRLTLEKVDESLCDANTKPNETQICGSEECAPHWVEGVWNKCSKACGKDGVQNRTVSCERISPNGVASVVDDNVCLKAVGNKPADTQECNRNIENCPKYHIGPWTPCDKMCGNGKRSRKLICFKEENGKKKVLTDSDCSEEKPVAEEACILAPCEGVDWIVSQWSGCDKCGQTKETRMAICGSKSGKLYNETFCSAEKPVLARLCKSTKCETQWFSSQWSKCSAKCGKGIQSRIVICGEFDGTTVTPASDDSKCIASERPSSEQECEAEETECPGEWFTGPWGMCSKACGGGQRTREVLCLANGTKVSTCEESKIEFGSENCNNQPCTNDENIPINIGSRFINEDEESGEECDEDYDEQDFGVEFVTEKRKEDLKLGEGIELDIAATTLSSLIMDDLMLSDSPSIGDDYVTPDLSTEFPETTMEGSGDGSEVTIGFSTAVGEGSGDDNEDDITTTKFITETTEPDPTQETTDITSSSTQIIESSTDSPSPSLTQETELQSTSSEILSSKELSTESTVLSSITDTSTENSLNDKTTVLSSDETTVFTDLKSTSDISSTMVTELSTEQRSSFDTTTENSSTNMEDSTSSFSSTEATSSDATETTSDKYTETTLAVDTEAITDSTTETTSDSSTELTSDSSTETTSDSSTETTPNSSTETTSESTTETTVDISSETTSDSTTEITSENSTEMLLESSTEQTSKSNIETTSDGSTQTSTDSNTETILDRSTESTEKTTDITSTSIDSSTELTSLTDDATDVSESSTAKSSDFTTDATSDSYDKTTISYIDHSYSTEGKSDSTTDVTISETSDRLSTEFGLIDTTDIITDETTESSKSSEWSTVSSTIFSPSQETTDITTEETVDSIDTSLSLESTTSGEISTSFDSTTTTEVESSSSTGTTESTDTTETSSTEDATTVDIWSSEASEFTEGVVVITTPNTLEAALDRETKPRKCRPRKTKKQKCVTSEFGCCPDKKTIAKGPFGLSCPIVKTCIDSEFGCCLDGLSPAQGKNNEGCPKSMCEESLFGCCPDNFTAAEGEENDGCPELTTESPISTFTPENDSEETTVSSDITDVTESSSEEELDVTDSTEATDTTENPIKTIKSCSFDEFGCCPDGKTTAQGENFKGCDIVDEKDCSKSLYGCCRDGKSSARGPNEEGCGLCTREPYGCCPDGVTPAHGTLGEGCCLNTQFGCCPDNIIAARGPNFQDCDCKYTPYGCCFDNTTAARGYNYDGCPCDSSQFGCCPDKITRAAGEKFAGCPCHTMQFGCCPDGITIPQGPHHYGCHCSQTQHKCCSDEKTPAKGPNFEGCTCAESKFGCCPDGIAEAQGEKFEGCAIIKESPQKACGLPKETGTCSNFTIKYFFDTSYGACARFWYGGCDGNGNRFETEAECRDTCQEYKGKDTCLLPKSAGPCPGFQKKWHFNSERNRCEEFNYGGCYGTSNRFDSIDECKAHCNVEESLPPCEQPVDSGPCEGNFERWHYDNETDVCRQFTYGGCKGNKNNYATEHACSYHCKQPGVHKDLCTLSKENGNCGGNHARWHFSESNQKCLPFYYTGCGGNKNNFQSLESCEEHCPQKIAKDICEIPAEVGECQNYTPRWYWDTKDGRCRQFYYGGCGGNENNFAEEEQCSKRCERKHEEKTTPRPPSERPAEQPHNSVEIENRFANPPENTAIHGDEEMCFQGAAAGNCSGYEARWFYNADEGVCDQFIYTGCNGNANNFMSEDECEQNCFHVHSTCSLPAVYGRCNDNTTRWSYDEVSKRCFEFEFSGCRGNRNNFFTEQECMDYCQNTHPEEDAPPTEGYNLTHTADDQCDLPLEAGNCRDNIFSWYYNKDVKQCEGFYYTGCNGNANRFESREQCDRQCGQFKDVDVCNDPLVVGTCRQWETRFFFDKTSHTCEPFTYGGCGGSGNRFVDKAECQSVCIVGKEPTANRAICLLPPNVGVCPRATASERRWYYDDDRGTCFPFIYSGCSGNQNNFRSPNACVSFCANQTEQEKENEIETRPDEPTFVANRCESFEENCRTLRCPFGTKTNEGPDGCRRCECINPCADYSCPSGEKCAVDVASDPSLEAKFIPICRQMNKPGECPKLSNSSVCDRVCYDDADCRDDNKCCSEGCSHVCVRPQQSHTQMTTLSPPTPRTEVIFPGESAATLEPKKREEVDVTSSAGSVAVLRCFATGNPPPTVTWRRGAVLIDTNKGRYVLTSSGDLTIVQVHHTDSGSYICVASNGLGAPVTREINLQVSDTKTNITAYIYGPKNITQIVTIKQPAQIRCPAGGYPKPFVTWWRGKSRMALTTARYDTLRDYSLVFRSIELSDLGPYECTAYTGHGKPASMVVILKAVGPVHATNPNDEPFLKYILSPPTTPITSKPSYPYYPSRPQIRPPPPQVVDIDQRFGGENEVVTYPPKSVRASAIIRRDSSNNYTIGSDVVLNCDVGGYPTPNVTWIKDSIQVKSSNRIQITENPYRLVIYGVAAEDSGYYGCTARNTFSHDTSEEKILIESGVYVRPDCTDNKYFANCALIVKGRYCSNEYYAKFCCRSCTLAGQLPGGHPNSL